MSELTKFPRHRSFDEVSFFRVEDGKPSAAATFIDIAVRYSNGAYNTPTVRGQRASSTMSDGEAARKLASKLWGAGAACEHKTNLEAAVYVWRIAPSVGALKD